MPKRRNARSRTRAAAAFCCRATWLIRPICRSAVQKTIDALGKLDILVNNAAFQEHANKLEDISDEHFDRTIKTNLYGYFNMAKAAVPK